MEKIRVERNESMVRLWNDSEGIALYVFTNPERGKDRFCEVISSIKPIPQGREGIDYVNNVIDELRQFARENLPEVYYRSREDIRKTLSKKYPSLVAEHIEALTTLNMTDEELIFDLRKKYPSASEDMLASYARDEENNAHCILDADYDVAMYEYGMEHDDDEGCSNWQPTDK